MKPGLAALMTHVAVPVLADADFYRVEAAEPATTPLRALWRLEPAWPFPPRLVLAP